MTTKKVRTLPFLEKRSLSFKMTLISLLSIVAAITLVTISNLFIVTLLNNAAKYSNATKAIIYLGDIHGNIKELNSLAHQYIGDLGLNNKPTASGDDLDIAIDAINDAILNFSGEVVSSDGDLKAIASNLESNWGTVKPKLKSWRSAFETNTVQQTNEAFAALRDELNKIDSKAEESKSYIRETILKANEEASHMSTTIKIVDLISLVFFIFLGLFNQYTTKGITNHSRKLIDDLRDQTQSLNHDAGELNSTSSQLQQSSSQQSAAIQESIAAVTEMSRMMKSSSTNAAEADSLTQSVDQESKQGNIIMNNMVQSMDTIADANLRLNEIKNIIDKIDEKTNVINDIVFKTQLLSFNASIEAARAGHMGRGFAVVAEEVGRLAESSGLASQEITSLLEESKNQVDGILNDTTRRILEGKQVTAQALEAFSNIATKIDVVSLKVRDIAQAISEQETGIAQTNMAMKELNDAAQKNHEVSEATSRLSANVDHNGQVISQVMASLAQLILGGNITSPIGNMDNQKTAKKRLVKREPPIARPQADRSPKTVAPLEVEPVESVSKTSALPFTADDDSFKRVS